MNVKQRKNVQYEQQKWRKSERMRMKHTRMMMIDFKHYFLLLVRIRMRVWAEAQQNTAPTWLSRLWLDLHTNSLLLPQSVLADGFNIMLWSAKECISFSPWQQQQQQEQNVKHVLYRSYLSVCIVNTNQMAEVLHKFFWINYSANKSLWTEFRMEFWRSENQ